MTWVKLDDTFPEHSKVISLSDKAFRLHVTAICFAAKNETDGEIPRAALARLGGSPKIAHELHEVGLWETTSRGGWVVHDYLEYNRSRAELEAERQRKAEAGAKGAANRWAKAKPIAPAIAPATDVAIGNSMPPSRPVPSPETYNPSGYASLSAAEREIADTALSKLPLQYQRDSLAIDELGQFARDFASRPHVHRELAEAIAKCRQNGVLCFAGNLRKYMPGGQHGSNTRVGTSANPSPRRQQLIDAGIVER